MDPMVWYQTVEHTDGRVIIYSAPAIVTGRRQKGAQAKDEEGHPVLADEIEVLTLTVFHPGRISFETEVEPYADYHGKLGGSASYRPWDSDPPTVDPV